MNRNRPLKNRHATARRCARKSKQKARRSLGGFTP
jgi:hypothetical protein